MLIFSLYNYKNGDFMTITVEMTEYILFHHLKLFKIPGKFVEHGTTLGTVLSKKSTMGVSPRQMFYDVTRYDIFNNGGSKEPWPNDWDTKNCLSLAPILAEASKV